MKLILKLIFLFPLSNAYIWDPVVHTPSGKIRGLIRTSRSGLQYLAFLGIYYAEPPVGDLRFEPPVPQKPWNEIYNATTDGPLCPQATTKPISEDCLILNVYASLQTFSPKPVIVYIHGGALEIGSSQDRVLGAEYLMDRDIILVTVNYRLGPFGFLSTGTQEAPGNVGLKDQVVALKWIQNHIESFGGDKNLVTIFGQSAGGRSVTAHIASPMSAGLFHRAIVMSGSVTAQWQIQNDLLDLTKRIAKIVGCPDVTPSEIVACLKETPMEVLARSTAHLHEWSKQPILSFFPVVENDFGQERFLLEDPKTSFEMGNFNRVPIIAGITRDEFAKPAWDILKNDILRVDLDQNFTKLAPLCFLYERNTRRSIHASAQLRSQFLDGALSFTNDSLARLNILFADGITSFGVHRFVHLVAKHTPVYYYKNSFVGRYSHFYQHDHIPYGVVHKDDLQYIFHLRHLSPPIGISDPETVMVERMTRLWTNFAVTGNPNNADDFITANINWTPFDYEHENYLDMGLQFVMEKRLFLERFSVWDELFPLHPRADADNAEVKTHDLRENEVIVQSNVLWIYPKKFPNKRF